MNKKSFETLSLGIFAIIISAALIGFGVFNLKQNKEKSLNCTESVIAEVIENKVSQREERSKTHKMTDQKQVYTTITSYTPVFEYSFKEKTFKSAGRATDHAPLYQVGEKVELMVDPSSPITFYIPSAKESVVHEGRNFFILGAVVLAFGIIIIILSIKKKKES